MTDPIERMYAEAFAPPTADDLQDDPGEVFTTELTPEGEQYVIPGAEKRTTAKKPQGELFG